MTPSEMLAVRADCAKEIAQKAEALRHEAEVEVFRYEGAVGALKQVLDVARPAGKTPVVPEDFADAVKVLVDQAQAELLAARGRVQQGERTLDMLEALFQADVAAAQKLLKTATPDKQAKGRHPGPSIRTRRTAKASVDAESHKKA